MGKIPHRAAKILHRAAIFWCLYSEESVLNTVGSHFAQQVAILKPVDQLFLDRRNAKNRFLEQGTDCREANFPHRNIVLQSQ